MTGITTYNRGFGGNGPQHMLYELERPDINKEIPNAGFVIYTFIPDHIQRIKMFFPTIFQTMLQPKYSIQNGKLKEDKIIFLPYHYTFFSRLRGDDTISKKINRDKNIELLNAIIEKSYSTAKFHYSDIKFVLFIYEDNNYPAFKPEELNKLKQKGIIILNAETMLGQSIQNENLTIEDKHHPNEKVWDKLAPIIIKKLNLCKD